MVAAKDYPIVVPKYAAVFGLLLAAIVVLDYWRYRTEPGGKQWQPIGMASHAKTKRR